MAEVYWDLEWTMQQQVFDYVTISDLRPAKRRTGAAGAPSTFAQVSITRTQAIAIPGEPRRTACRGDISNRHHQAAAVFTFLSPGLRFFHDGQIEGRQKRISPHLV